MLANPTQAEDRRFDFLLDFTARLSSRDIELPPFPDVYVRILDAISDPELSFVDVSRIVMSAPDLSVRLLLMANSALLNRVGVKVTDMSVAVSRLGLAVVKSATITMAARNMFVAPKGSEAEKRLNHLREESVRVAAYCYLLSTRAKLSVLKDNAMLAGLLHNVGEHYLLSRAQDFPEMLSAEMTREWVPSISRALIDNWGFPDEIAAAVEEAQSDPGGVEAKQVGIAQLLTGAMLLYRASTLGVESVDWASVPACALLRLDSEQAVKLLTESTEEVESLVSALG